MKTKLILLCVASVLGAGCATDWHREDVQGVIDLVEYARDVVHEEQDRKAERDAGDLGGSEQQSLQDLFAEVLREQIEEQANQLGRNPDGNSGG